MIDPRYYEGVFKISFTIFKISKVLTSFDIVGLQIPLITVKKLIMCVRWMRDIECRRESAEIGHALSSCDSALKIAERQSAPAATLKTPLIDVSCVLLKKF